ncbi:MAG: hypothetical protein ABIJ11_06015 [Elusimicrobiota bacterium]
MIYFVGWKCGINHFSVSTAGTFMRASGMGYTVGPQIEIYDTKNHLGFSLDLLYEFERTTGNYWWDFSEDKVIRIPLLANIAVFDSEKLTLMFGIGNEIYYIWESKVISDNYEFKEDKHREGKSENFFVIGIRIRIEISSKIKLSLETRLSRNLTTNTISNTAILESLQLLIGIDYKL